MTIQEHKQRDAGLEPGRRILRMKTGFLPVLMSKGIHHYSVGKDALPEDCRIVDVCLAFQATLEAGELILLLESEEWEAKEGIPSPEVNPSLVRHRCLPNQPAYSSSSDGRSMVTSKGDRFNAADS